MQRGRACPLLFGPLLLALEATEVREPGKGNSCDAWPRAPSPLQAPDRAVPSELSAYWAELAQWHTAHPRGRVLSQLPLMVQFDDFLDDAAVDALWRMHEKEVERLTLEAAQAEAARWCIMRRAAFGFGLGDYEDYSEDDVLQQLRHEHGFEFLEAELEKTPEQLCFVNATRVQALRERVPHSTLLFTAGLARDYDTLIEQEMYLRIERYLGLCSQKVRPPSLNPPLAGAAGDEATSSLS